MIICRENSEVKVPGSEVCPELHSNLVLDSSLVLESILVLECNSSLVLVGAYIVRSDSFPHRPITGFFCLFVCF